VQRQEPSRSLQTGRFGGHWPEQKGGPSTSPQRGSESMPVVLVVDEVVVEVVLLWVVPVGEVVVVVGFGVSRQVVLHASQQLAQALTRPPLRVHAAALRAVRQREPRGPSRQQVTVSPDRPQTERAAQRFTARLHAGRSPPVRAIRAASPTAQRM